MIAQQVEQHRPVVGVPSLEEVKAFHCEIQNDHKALAAEEKGYQKFPPLEY